jgi:hypothetical protein
MKHCTRTFEVDHLMCRVYSGPVRNLENKISNKRNFMSIDISFFETWRTCALAIFSIVTAYLLVSHGTAMLFGSPHVELLDRPRGGG